MTAAVRPLDDEGIHRRSSRDYTKEFPCPECGELMWGVCDDDPSHRDGVIWMCNRAIGEVAWDPDERRRYFPWGSIHRGHVKHYRERKDGTLQEY